MGTRVETAAQIIMFDDLEGVRKRKIEQWLKGRMLADYGDADKVTIENPLLRITTKFEALSEAGQIELFGFAKKRIGEDPGLKDLLWEVLKKGSRSDGSWEDIDEFADSIIIREETYKKTYL